MKGNDKLARDKQKYVPSNSKGYEEEKKDFQKKIDTLLTKNGESELFNRVFLKPIEIALRYSSQEGANADKLPCGLYHAMKPEISANKYDLVEFPSWASIYNPTSKDKFEDKISTLKAFQETNCDNLVSVLKGHKESKLKVAICICMYSEDKAMLRRTLEGVKSNVAEFIKNGTASNEIVVCVVMDGIEVVDPSVIDYFQQVQKESGVYLTGDVQRANINEINLDQENYDDDDQEAPLNINQYIFEEEYEQRKKRQFAERIKQYAEAKNMIKRIEALEIDKSVTFASLDKFIEPFFYEVAKQKYKRQYAIDDDNIKKEVLIAKYAENINVSKPLIREALSLAKRHCLDYISMRDNLALLNSFRVELKMIHTGENGHIIEEQNHQNTLMNLFFLTKYKNKGKLTSHNWFLNGFCQELKPEYMVLLDVGLAPEKDAIFKMIKYMERDPQTGGVCGYMGLKIQRVDDGEELDDKNIDCLTSISLRLFDIQRAQQMEYHFAHLIDKPFEACFDFIHVLPGAFSAYRMEALRPSTGQSESLKLLEDYFQSIRGGALSSQIEKVQFSTIQAIMKVIIPDFIYECCYPPKKNTSQALLYNENVYLAEDRTLCLGIYLHNKKLKYLPDAYAWVDPIKTLYGLLGQRKRWINGSFFAFSKVNRELREQNRGSCALHMQIMYLQFMNWLAFISPALFLFTIHVAMTVFYSEVIIPIIQSLVAVDDSIIESVNIFVFTIDFAYVMMFLGLIFYSMHMTHRQPQFQPYIYATATIYGIISIIIFVILLYDIIKGLLDQGQTSFLFDNPDFVDALPGNGTILINSLRYIIIGIMCLYGVPVIVYFLLYCRGDIVIDIILSSLSFMFYGPTYLNVLNIYALCRIDDISWGTKGLDTGSSSGKDLAENWKKIKLLHVSKLVFWNSVAGFVLLFLGNDYVNRFFLTYVIMIVLAGTMLIKVFMAVGYLIVYKCSIPDGYAGDFNPKDYVEQCYQKISPVAKSQVKNSIMDTTGYLLKQNKIGKQCMIEVLKKPELSQIYRKKNHRKERMNIHNSRIEKSSIQRKQQKPNQGSEIKILPNPKKTSQNKFGSQPIIQENQEPMEESFDKMKHNQKKQEKVQLPQHRPPSTGKQQKLLIVPQKEDNAQKKKTSHRRKGGPSIL